MTNTRIAVELAVLLLIILGLGWLFMVLLPVAFGSGSAVDPQIPVNPPPQPRISFARVVESGVDAGASQLPRRAKDTMEWVTDRWDLHPTDIETVGPSETMAGSPALTMTLTENAAAQMTQYSRSLIGQKMAIIVDDQIVVVATVNEAMSSQFIVSGSFSAEEIRGLVRSLNPSHP